MLIISHCGIVAVYWVEIFSVCYNAPCLLGSSYLEGSL